MSDKAIIDRSMEDAIHGWGVWHNQDEEWIGFGATNGIAAELIPDGAEYAHLSLRPAVAHIAANPDDEDYLTDDEVRQQLDAAATNWRDEVSGAWQPAEEPDLRMARDIGNENPVEVERRRIWAAIQSWEEGGLRIDGDGNLAPTEGFTHKPLSPFFDELHAIVFGETDKFTFECGNCGRVRPARDGRLVDTVDGPSMLCLDCLAQIDEAPNRQPQ